MNENESKITYNVTQCYLEMARAVYTKWRLPIAREFSSDRQLKSLVGQFSFLIVSLTVIYSYLAIEAWVNYWLHEIWQQCRVDSGKKYPAFPQKYRQVNEFTKLKGTELRDLKERIKVLCDSYQVARIDRSNPKLWQDFNDLLEEARHFLIHPFPDPKKFQDCMEMIQQKRGLRKWTKIAEGIISHFIIKQE